MTTQTVYRISISTKVGDLMKKLAQTVMSILLIGITAPGRTAQSAREPKVFTSLPSAASSGPNVPSDSEVGSPDAVLHPNACSVSTGAPSWCKGNTATNWIESAISALPVHGGTIDLRGFNRPILLTNSIDCGAGVRLLSDYSVEIQPAVANLTMMSINPGCQIQGFWFDVSNQPAFSGRVISLIGSYQSYNVPGGSTANTHTSISDVKITAPGIYTGDAVYIQPAAGQGVAFVTFSNLNITGFYDCLHLYAGTGFINANNFHAVTCIYSVYGVNFDTKASSKGLIDANAFTDFQFEDGTSSTAAGILYQGTGLEAENSFVGAAVFDTTSVPSVKVMGTNVKNNFFMGHLDGRISDTTSYPGGNDYELLAAGKTIWNIYAAPAASAVQLLAGPGSPYDLLVPNQAQTQNNMIMDDSGNLSMAGTVAAGAGTKVIYRCTTQGAALPIGSLTTNSSACGTSVDTGLRVK